MLQNMQLKVVMKYNSVDWNLKDNNICVQSHSSLHMSDKTKFYERFYQDEESSPLLQLLESEQPHFDETFKVSALDEVNQSFSQQLSEEMQICSNEQSICSKLDQLHFDQFAAMRAQYFSESSNRSSISERQQIEQPSHSPNKRGKGVRKEPKRECRDNNIQKKVSVVVKDIIRTLGHHQIVQKHQKNFTKRNYLFLVMSQLQSLKCSVKFLQLLRKGIDAKIVNLLHKKKQNMDYDIGFLKKCLTSVNLYKRGRHLEAIKVAYLKEINSKCVHSTKFKLALSEIKDLRKGLKLPSLDLNMETEK